MNVLFILNFSNASKNTMYVSKTAEKYGRDRKNVYSSFIDVKINTRLVKFCFYSSLPDD